MACSAVRSPFLRSPTIRHYVAAAAAQPAAAASGQTQVLSNGVTIAAVENNSPVAQVSIVFRAGPRNETYDTQGTVHHLRIAAGLGTHRSSAFGITRNIQQLGGNLSVTSDRESIAYTLQITQNNLDKALVFLEDVATQQAFKPWEVSDEIPRLRYELSTLPETSRIIELLHKAAYRNGLGYSLFSPKRQLGKIGSETLQHFVNNWLTGNRCAVVATGVPLSRVSPFGLNLNVTSEGKKDEPSKYYGGELRKERNSQLATVALAVEGKSMKDEKDALACAVLQRAMGSGPRVKWGSSVSPLQKSVGAAAAPSIAGSLTKAAYACLKSPKLSDADIARGKATLKTEILCSGENNHALLEHLGQQTLFKGQISTPMSLASAVDKISTSDVNNVAGKLASGKVSLAAIGDLCSVPYADQLS
ncbi:hypothetical protein KM043_011475 [Ampulex compressa]|nr:hypothetical protein KM043_011475 [Ampulex compressa]